MRKGVRLLLQQISPTPTVSPALFSRGSGGYLTSGKLARINEPRIELPSMATITADFVGKATASVVENPHKCYRTVGGNNRTILFAPSDTATGQELNSVEYGYISDLATNNLSNGGTSVLNAYAQHMFSFNLIRAIELKYGKIPARDTAGKVAWLKANLLSLGFNWYGYGSSVGGNRAEVRPWSGASWATGYNGIVTSGSVTKTGVAMVASLINNIDANGFAHYIAFANPSDGVTTSTLNTDYVSLDIQFKSGVQLNNPSVMVEEGTTNLLVKPTTFSDSAWIKGASAESNGILTDDVSVSVHGLTQNTTLSAGTTYTLCAELSKQNGNLVAIGRSGGTDIYTDRYAIFDLNTGTIARQPTGTNSAKITPLGNGVYRCVYTCTPVSASTSVSCNCAYASDGNSNNEILHAGVGNQRFQIYKTQLEQKLYPTSFVDGVRANEVLSIPTTGVLNPTQGTIHQWVYVDSRARRQGTNQSNRIFRILNSANNATRISAYHELGSAYWTLATLDDSGNANYITVADSPTPDGWHLFTACWSATEAKILIDGGVAKSSFANPKLPTNISANMYVGSSGVDQFLNVPIGQTLICSDYQSDATIATIYANGFDGVPNTTMLIKPRIKTKTNK